MHILGESGWWWSGWWCVPRVTERYVPRVSQREGSLHFWSCFCGVHQSICGTPLWLHCDWSSSWGEPLVNESITAHVIVSLWSYFPLSAKKLWSREEYKIMLIFYLRITKNSPQSSLCYCELLFFPFDWLIERVRKINEGNLNFMFYFLLLLDKWRTLLN